MCNKRFFQLSEDWSLSVFEASVTRVCHNLSERSAEFFGGQRKPRRSRPILAKRRKFFLVLLLLFLCTVANQ